MNLLVLMAGASTAFADSNYPKNLVEVEGVPLVERVLDNLKSLRDAGAKLICAVSMDEQRRFHTSDVVRLIDPKAEVIEVRAATGGAACTALLAAEFINSDEPLVITNGDQIIDAELVSVIEGFQKENLDAATIVFEAVHPRWSYVRLGESGYVVEAAEKKPISRHATAGFYYFAKGRSFVSAAFSMIEKDAHVGGQFYVCPSFNEMILKQAKIGIYQIPRDAYHSLSTPDNVALYAQGLSRQ